jgi:hypothetical protein
MSVTLDLSGSTRTHQQIRQDEVNHLFAALRPTPTNPLAEYLSDELFQILKANDLLNEKAMRDFMIRKTFFDLKKNRGLTMRQACVEMKRLYPYLQEDTIRKIAYRVTGNSRKRMM